MFPVNLAVSILNCLSDSDRRLKVYGTKYLTFYHAFVYKLIKQANAILNPFKKLFLPLAALTTANIKLTVDMIMLSQQINFGCRFRFQKILQMSKQVHFRCCQQKHKNNAQLYTCTCHLRYRFFIFELFFVQI